MAHYGAPHIGVAAFPGAARLISINLTKPESTLDHVKKTYPKLKPTDSALIATALVLSGRYALAVYDEANYSWPDEYEKLTKSLLTQLHQIQMSVEGPAKKSAKAIAEEEAIEVKVGLIPNYAAGEKILGDRKDLKTFFSDLLEKGVEYTYSPTDIGWQWALDRASWGTLSKGEITRKIKLKTAFQDNATGIETGTGAPKKRASRAKAAVVAEDVPESAE